VRNRDLRRTESAFALFVAAEHGSWVAILVYAYLQGGSAEVGLAAFAQLFPAALLAPLAGAAADRLGAVRMLIGGYCMQSLAMASTGVALAAGTSAWLTYAIAAVAAVTVTMTRPTQALLTPALARSPLELGAVNVLSGWITAGGALIAPALAGLLVAVASPSAALFAAAAATATAAALTARIPRARTPTETGNPLRRAFADVGEGLRVIRGHRPVRLVIALIGALFVLVGAVDVLAVVLALGKLGLGRGGSGYLAASFGAGGIAGAAFSITLIGRRRLAPHFVAAALACGAALVLLGLWTTVASALALLMLAGAGRIVFDVAAQTLLQRAAPSHVLSRIFAVAEALAMAGLALGSLAVPALVALGGVRVALIGVGALLPVVVLLRLRALVAIDDSATVPVVEISLLRNMRLFALLPPPALEGLAHALTPLELPADTNIIVQGDQGDRLYAIADGTVDVIASGRFVTTLERGEAFGEIALLYDIPRTATVRARTNVRLYALEREAFLVALTGHATTHVAAQGLVDDRMRELRELRDAELIAQATTPADKTSAPTPP
jgi:MFS family permease